MKKKISFNKEAREALIRGVGILAKAVTTTLGPQGRNVGLGRKWNPPKVVHDGVSVAKEIDVDDPFEQMGVEMVREAATKTNDIAGDGTTTSILLAQALVEAGNKEVESGANPMIIQKGLQKAVDKVVEELAKMSKPVKDSNTIEQVASLSAASPEVGKLISTAIDKVGKKGIVMAESGNSLNTDIEYKEGMEFDRGYISPGFVTDEERMEAEVDNPYIFVTSERISTNKQILPILNVIGDVEKGNKFGIVIIADKVEYEALASFFINFKRGLISALAIEAPGFGDKREEMLEDIACLVGGKVFSIQKGNAWDNLNIDMFGHADKVWSNRESSRIVGGKGDKEAISLRVKQIENQIAKEKSDFEKEKLEERVARMAGSVAIIKVGAATEMELSDKVERVKDAVSATKSAIAEGVIPGGGVALLRARNVLDLANSESDEAIGEKILYDVLRKPIEKLFEIAGEDEKEIEGIEESEIKDYGYNVVTKKYGSMFEMGVIDPTRVVRSGLQNAVSVAGTILTTEALVAVVDEEDRKEL